MTEVISIKFKNRGKVYFFDPHGIAVRTGEKVVVETSRGLELAECVAPLRAMQAAGKAPEDGEGGSSGDDGGKDEPTYTVTIKGVDAATATFLLENYDNATAEQEQG